MARSAGKAADATGATSSARAAVLDRVRQAIAQGAEAEPDSDAAAGAAWEALPRAYQREAAGSAEETLAVFEDRLRDYDAWVERVDGDAVAAAIVRRLAANGCRSIVVPEGLPPMAWPAGTMVTTGDGLSHAELDAIQGVLTTATVGIASTGTIVMQHGAGQGRRAATLIPDYHLCLVAAADVVETVPEAMRRLAGTAALPTTFVSGPSATADIEMTRIKGVHGPRQLDVLLIVS